ncbi:hypothetical protein EYZ11_012905 [Aspergillus tanneri]|uniref:Uncharacterized protein n=1 Tax=Aspergillus tanneri TaxID=1220188 RepID=A0A4S3J163_9EURO|nr:hypothetical protein EYZ11_012905 [Aspergillus tanneri]
MRTFLFVILGTALLPSAFARFCDEAGYLYSKPDGGGYRQEVQLDGNCWRLKTPL